MKKIPVEFKIILAIYLLVIVVIMPFLFSLDETDSLEIYTPKNIYYIDGLTVSNEKNDLVLTFADKESLKNYIANITAEEATK